jgi:hypothetical protein
MLLDFFIEMTEMVLPESGTKSRELGAQYAH